MHSSGYLVDLSFSSAAALLKILDVYNLRRVFELGCGPVSQ